MKKKQTSVDIIETLLYLFHESEKRCSDNEAIKKLFQSLRSDLPPLWERCFRLTNDYKVAFVGLGNVGKSTLINALLGYKVAPSYNAACTASIVEFRYGEAFRIEAERSGTLMPDERNYKCVEQLCNDLSDMCTHGDGGKEECWTRIRVYLPSEMLSSGLILVDTPGFGAAGNLGEEDDTLLKDFLKKEVSQIFWVSCTEGGGISEREFDFYNRFLKWRCDDLTLTNGEEWDAQRRSKFKEKFAQDFRKTLKFHFVNGKQGAEARRDGDVSVLEESGIADLEKRVRKLKEEDGRFVGVLETIKTLGKITQRIVRDMGEDNSIFVPTLRAQFVEKYRTEPLLAPWIEMMSAKN